jgi:hypothetical protein
MSAPAQSAGCTYVSAWSVAKIGGCDDSPNRHASKHAREVSHPIIRSAEPGEDWSWCYIDNVAFVLG